MVAGVHLALLEEPRRTLAGGTFGAALQACNRWVGCGRINAAAERLGNPASGIGEAEAAGGRVQATGAASLGGLQAILDSGKLNLEPRTCVSTIGC